MDVTLPPTSCDLQSACNPRHAMAAAAFAAADEDHDLHHVGDAPCPTRSGQNARVENMPHFRRISPPPPAECPDRRRRRGDGRADSGPVRSPGAWIASVGRDREYGDDVANRRRIVEECDSAAAFVPASDLEPPSGGNRSRMVDDAIMGGMPLDAAGQSESRQGKTLRMDDADKPHGCRGVFSELKNISDEDATTCGSYDEVEEREFTIAIDDPAGNSYIEDPNAPHRDPNLRCEEYEHTPNHEGLLGLQPSTGAIHMGPIENHNLIENDPSPSRRYSLEVDEHRASSIGSRIGPMREKVMTFPTTCPHCRTRAETKMRVTDIPHFKEVVIMCLQCEHCGYRSNEIKGGVAIPRLGTKITLRAMDVRDLAREVLKSDTSGVSVPELDLELDEGGLGGMYTTVEGLLLKMHDGLRDVHPFGPGDSSVERQSTCAGEVGSAPRRECARYDELLTQLKDAAMGLRFPFTLILVDPCSNTFVGPRCGTMHFDRMCDDEGLEIEEFERTDDQNEGLGLNDIRTETN
jgi:zinc finger protein